MTNISKPFDGTIKQEPENEYMTGYKDGIADAIFAAHTKDADMIEEWRTKWKAAGKLTPWMDNALCALRNEILSYRTKK